MIAKLRRGGPNSGDDSRTEQMGNLNASQADAPGGGRHEHDFTGLQPRTIDQRIPGREIAVLYC